MRIASTAQCGWSLRVLSEKRASSSGKEIRGNSGAQRENDSRVQEIVVETHDHSLDLALLPEAQFSAILRTVKERYDQLSAERSFAHVSLWKNQGKRAGAGLEHSHCGLVATAGVPPPVSKWMQQASCNYGKFGTCVFCRMLQEELEAQHRVVLVSEHFAVVQPFASPTPFCTHLYPMRHMANFGEANTNELKDLARILRDVLARLYFGFENPDFSLALRSAPTANAGAKYCHWSIAVLPRLMVVGEPALASGTMINPVLPEQAAEILRGVDVRQAISE
jgi:UDPglucose--hexose-1-phosphate uridylyltransferase